MNTRRIITSYAVTVIAGCALLICGCENFLANQTASLGGDTAGGRGTLRVLFINNTPHQAVFTYGTYDQTDPSFVPDFAQFTREGDITLDAGEASSLVLPSALTLDVQCALSGTCLTCARVFGIGSPALLRLIRDNVPTDNVGDEQAMLEGVEFFGTPVEDVVDEDAEDAGDEEGTDAEDADDVDPEDEDAAEPTSQGFAPPFEALLGVDFPCNALLIIRFEIDEPAPDASFRVDFELVPSESDR